MLPQRHGDAEKRALKYMKTIDEFCRLHGIRKSLLLHLCLFVSVVLSLSCSSKITDPRTVIPADSLVYLETTNLGKALDAITSNPEFLALAKNKPDLSSLDGIKLSVAVTGFQTSEEAISDEGAILNFKPRFVAVAETNAWNYQALSFTENKLGEFVNEIYGGEIELVTNDKHNGKYFTWTAKDGRKAYALVRGSLVFFGNDESALDRCIVVMNGEADSIAKNPKVADLSADALASGYVSKDGVAQIANIAGVSLAMAAGEESEVKSFIARVVPEIVRNSVTEVAWTSRRSNDGNIEDKYKFSLGSDTATVLGETFAPGNEQGREIERFIPNEYISVTRYNLKEPRIAWRSLLLSTRAKTDRVSGDLIGAFSSALFEPYGIEEPEVFLGSLSGAFRTVRFDSNGDDVVLIAETKDIESSRPEGIAKEFKAGTASIPEFPDSLKVFGTLWSSEDGELLAGRAGNLFIIGDAASVTKSIAAYLNSQQNVPVSPISNAAIETTGNESDPAARLVTALADRKDNETPLTSRYSTETRFNQNGIERRTVSDFGLIGASLVSLIEETEFF